MTTYKYNNNWDYLREVIQPEDIIKINQISDFYINQEDYEAKLLYCSTKGVHLIVKNQLLPSYMLTVMLEIQQEIANKKKESHMQGIQSALHKKKEGKGEYGRPKVEIPDNFIETVNDYKRRGIPLTVYQKELNMPSSTFYKKIKECRQKQRNNQLKHKK